MYYSKNGLILPKKRLDSILIFIDETYLFQGSGFLQSAISIPSRIYIDHIIPTCKKLLLKLGDKAKEFKGVKIKPGNANIYRDFLSCFINVIAEVGDNSELQSIVTLDAADSYIGEGYDRVFNSTNRSLLDFNLNDVEGITKEFSLQILWLLKHYSQICSVPISNEVVLRYDEKHEFAKETRTHRLLYNENLIVPVFYELEKLLTRISNTVLNRTPDHHIPKISNLTFKASYSEFGLQAADLLCHLVYNSLKYEMGIQTSQGQLKREILLEVVPNFEVSSELRSFLSVQETPSGQHELRCNKSKLISTFSFKPLKS